MSINRVVISGNLTRDPDLRSTQDGTQVLTLGVAVNDRRRNPQTGEWEGYPNYVDCVLFGSRAEAVSRFLTKGAKVAIEGKLRYSSWEREGQKRSKLEVIVDEIEFMSQRQQQSDQQPQQAAQPVHQPVQQAQPAFQPGVPSYYQAPQQPVQQYQQVQQPVLQVMESDIPF